LVDTCAFAQLNNIIIPSQGNRLACKDEREYGSNVVGGYKTEHAKYKVSLKLVDGEADVETQDG